MAYYDKEMDKLLDFFSEENCKICWRGYNRRDEVVAQGTFFTIKRRSKGMVKKVVTVFK